MEINNNLNIYKEERPWGRFLKFIENKNSTVKILNIKPNSQLSLQSHMNREEFWYVIKGSGTFKIGDQEYNVTAGDQQYVSLGMKHRIVTKDEELSILEIAFGKFDEMDIIRYEDVYGRV